MKTLKEIKKELDIVNTELLSTLKKYNSKVALMQEVEDATELEFLAIYNHLDYCMTSLRKRQRDLIDSCRYK